MLTIEKLDIERNLQQRVYQIIKDYLIRPEIPPGTRLYEEKLSKEIGVSRTPVRMALQRLEHEGLVQITPNRGTSKVHLSWKEVTEIVKIRETLEILSLQMVEDFDAGLIEDLVKLVPDFNFFENSKNMLRYPEFDQKFHETLIQFGKSEWLFKIIKNLDTINQMLRLISIQDIERIKSSIEEHRKILEAVKMNDMASAITYTRQHYDFSLKDLEQKKENIPGLFL